MIILKVSDFISRDSAGVFKIPIISGCEEDVQIYIDRFEKTYLIKLLGCDLANLFIEDLIDGTPQSPRFVAIYNEICEDLSNYAYCGKTIESCGVKSMLQGFIYWEYMRNENAFSYTPVGVKRNKAENSEDVVFSSWGIHNYYNKSIKDFQNIQFYILKNKHDYTEFNGTKLKFTNPII